MLNYPFTAEQMALLTVARTTWDRRRRAKERKTTFGEETVTETILMDLLDTFPGDLEVVQFNKIEEGKNGSDWAWAFRDVSGTINVAMLVQAKVLDLKDVGYPELWKTVGKAKTLQIEKLLASSQQLGIPAVYAFYNHLTDTSHLPDHCMTLANAGLLMPECWGISLAAAEAVYGALAAKDKTFKTHRAWSVPLHCLLCSSGLGHRQAGGSPGHALTALTRLRTLRPASAGWDAPPSPLMPLGELPSLFRDALNANRQQNDERRESDLALISAEYPSVAGVVVLQDRETPKRR